MHTGGRHDQVADAGQTRKGVDVAAHGHTQPGDLGNAAGDEGRAGVVTIAKTGRDAHAQRDHVLQRAAQLHAFDIGVGVHPHTGVAEHVLHKFCSPFIRAGRNDGGGHVQCHLFGMGGTGERYQLYPLGAALTVQLVGDNLGHGI